MKPDPMWQISSSDLSKRCINPIRNIVEGLVLTPNPEKQMIALSIGDPTAFGHLKADPEMVEAVINSVESFKYNGYGPSSGHEIARAAVAKYVSTPKKQVEAKDVVLCSGCSHSIDLCLSVLANPGQNILVPRPGFPLYKMIAECLGVEYKFYNLLSNDNWLVDLDHLESLIDGNTVAIVVNTPSNPCGSVFPEDHVRAILEIAARHRVPIISDDVYENFVFPGQTFNSFADISENVPILSCGGLTKRFLVPGWRLGWIVIYDYQNAFAEVRKGLLSLSQRILGCNAVMQGALPAILEKVPQTFFKKTVASTQASAELAYREISQIPGLRPIMPYGAMFMMVEVEMDKFPQYKNDFEFVETMVSEQSVFLLPGAAFDFTGFVRLSVTVPIEMMSEACSRIAEFCKKHYQPAVKVANLENRMENVVFISNGFGHHENGISRKEMNVFSKIQTTNTTIINNGIEIAKEIKSS